MPDRRSFLKGAAMASPLLAFSEIGKAQPYNFPTQPFLTSGTMEITAFTGAAEGAVSQRAFSNQAISILGARNIWSTYNLDQVVKQRTPLVTESMLYPYPRVNSQYIYNFYKPYFPSLTLIGMAEAIQALSRAGAAIGLHTQVLYAMRNNGVIPYLNMAINMSNVLGSQGAVPYDNGNDIPRTGENPGCKTDGAAILAVGTALLVLTIMTDGLDLLVYGAVWSAVAWWGGVGVGGWSIMHAMKCGF